MSGPSRFVFEAVKRRQDAGQCGVCGEPLRPSLRGGPYCINYDDGRHRGPARRKIRVKKK